MNNVAIKETKDGRIALSGHAGLSIDEALAVRDRLSATIERARWQRAEISRDRLVIKLDNLKAELGYTRASVAEQAGLTSTQASRICNAKWSAMSIDNVEGQLAKLHEAAAEIVAEEAA